MEEIQFSLTDPNALTRSSSPASFLTTDNSGLKPIGEHCECAAQADEIHDQYLNRLEASFVTQLHRSTSWLARWPNRSTNKHLSVNQPGKKASEQFTVFRDGCWEKIKFGKITSTGSHDVFRSPWVKHFKHGDKSCSTSPPDVNDSSKNHHEENCLQDPLTSSHKIGRYSPDMIIDVTCSSSAGSTSGEVKLSSCALNEGSGQNFVYEDCDNEATFQADTSSADQIVPSSDIDARIQATIGNIPAEDQARS